MDGGPYGFPFVRTKTCSPTEPLGFSKSSKFRARSSSLFKPGMRDAYRVSQLILTNGELPCCDKRRLIRIIYLALWKLSVDRREYKNVTDQMRRLYKCWDCIIFYIVRWDTNQLIRWKMHLRSASLDLKASALQFSKRDKRRIFLYGYIWESIKKLCSRNHN